jgi:hypothetical protein
VAAVSTRSYRELAIVQPPNSPGIDEVLSLFRTARSRAVRPEGRIVLDSVNGEPAARSAYFGDLRASGFESDRGRMVLW